MCDYVGMMQELDQCLIDLLTASNHSSRPSLADLLATDTSTLSGFLQVLLEDSPSVSLLEMRFLVQAGGKLYLFEEDGADPLTPAIASLDLRPPAVVRLSKANWSIHGFQVEGLSEKGEVVSWTICARSRQEKEVWMEAIASALKVMQYDSKPTLPRLVQSRDQLELLKMELKEVQRKRKKLVESTNKASQFQAAILASQEHNLKASKGHRRTLSNSSSVRTNLDRFSFASNVSKAAFGVRPEDPDVLAHEYQKLFLNA